MTASFKRPHYRSWKFRAYS